MPSKPLTLQVKIPNTVLFLILFFCVKCIITSYLAWRFGGFHQNIENSNKTRWNILKSLISILRTKSGSRSVSLTSQLKLTFIAVTYEFNCTFIVKWFKYFIWFCVYLETYNNNNKSVHAHTQECTHTLISAPPFFHYLLYCYRTADSKFLAETYLCLKYTVCK
jgi:hypothetical protein